MRAGTEPVAVAAALAIALGIGLPTPASAQPSTSATAALQFDKGRTLMKEKKYAEACAAFEQSQKLDPQIGTLYNVGVCSAELGKVATAWAAYREVAERDANAARKKEAGRRAKELEKRLPKLRLTIATAPPGLAVTMNGADVTALVGADSPVDPAEYKLKATAPGFAAWETTVRITDEGKTVKLAIELLPPSTSTKEPVKPAKPAKPAPPPEPPPPAEPPGGDEARKSEPSPPRTDDAPRPPGQGRKRIAVALGIGGAASLGTGLVFGSLARKKWDEARALCGDDRVCDDPATLAQGNALVDAARGRANLSTALVIGGAVLAGAGAVLWLTAPSSSAASDTAAIRIAPELGPGHAAVTLGGRF